MTYIKKTNSVQQGYWWSPDWADFVKYTSPCYRSILPPLIVAEHLYKSISHQLQCLYLHSVLELL
jgi:hypothetical protein